MNGLRVLRVFHSGVVPEFRERERELRARGFDVHLACPPAWAEGGRLVAAAGDAELPVHVLPIRGHTAHPILFWYSQRALRRLLRELRPDVIDVHEEPYSLAARGILRAAARELPTAPVVVYTAQNVYKRYPQPFRSFERSALRRVAAAYPCSTEAADVLRRKGYEGPLHVVPLGVAAAPERDAPGAELRVGFVSRLVAVKGGRHAIEAFRRAPAAGPATLEIVGSGPEEAALRRLAGGDPRIHFTGALPQDETLERIGGYDVLLVPSLSRRGGKEQFCRVAAQALAAGTPVLAYDCGAIAEVLGGCGELVAEGDVEALARRLDALLGDPGRRAELRRLGRLRAEQSLTWSRVAERLDAVYRQALGVLHDEVAERRLARKRRLPLAPDPLRVALVNHAGSLGGGELSVLRLAGGLDPDRVALTLVAGEDGPFVERMRELGGQVIVAALDPRLARRRKDSLGLAALADPLLWRDLGTAVGAVTEILRRERIEIVHTNSMKSHVLGGVAGRLAGAKVLWHVRDHVAPPYLPAPAAHAMRVAARVLPHHVVTVSHSAARTIGRRDAIVMHQSVPLPELGPERTRSGPLRVGIVGRISPWKGQDVFLDAAERLATRFANVEFVVAGAALFGEHDLERRLRARAERDPLRGRVRFLGFCEDVEAVYRDLDVAVHASTLAEPYGNVVLEAMASRVATIAAAEGGPLELVEHGRTGLLVPPRDPKLLADALRSLLVDSRLRLRLAREARAHVERTYSLQRDVGRLHRLYDRIAA